MNVLNTLINQAKQRPRSVILPESSDERVLHAAVQAYQSGIAHPILVGNSEQLHEKASSLALDLRGVTVLSPEAVPQRAALAEQLYELRRHKGMTEEQAHTLSVQPLWFANLWVKNGWADGCVAGAVHTTADVVRTALQVLGTAPGVNMVSSFFIMLFDKPHHPRQGAAIFTDCALTIEPTTEQLADIALAAAQNARQLLNMEPRVALLSFSSSGSARHPTVDRVSQAVTLLNDKQPDLLVDGEVQFDAALLPEVAARKVANSRINGLANIFVFPSLEAGNIGYKIAERIGGAQAVGPFLQGLAQPANDLSRGCSSHDVYNTIAVTVLQSNQSVEQAMSRN